MFVYFFLLSINFKFNGIDLFEIFAIFLRCLNTQTWWAKISFFFHLEGHQQFDAGISLSFSFNCKNTNWILIALIAECLAARKQVGQSPNRMIVQFFKTKWENSFKILQKKFHQNLHGSWKNIKLIIYHFKTHNVFFWKI